MKAKDLFLALLVVALWGFNFVVIKVGLQGLTAMSLASFRFLFVIFPAIFFIPKPKVPFHLLAVFGFAQAFLQFAFLFSAISVGMPAGLASVMLQSQALFTLAISSLTLKERFTSRQLVGVIIAAFGLLIISIPQWQVHASGKIPGLGFLFIFLAALSWASGNVILRSISKKYSSEKAPLNMLSVTIWSSLLLPFLFALASRWVDGSFSAIASITDLSAKTYLCILYLSVCATMLGYGIWNHLIQKHSAVKVAPFSILVPVFGLTSAFVVLGEVPNIYQGLGSLVLLLGLLINLTKSFRKIA